MFPGIDFGGGFQAPPSGPTISSPGWPTIPGISLPGITIGGGGGGSSTTQLPGFGILGFLLAHPTNAITSALLRLVLLILGLILITAGLYMLKPVQRAVSTTTRVAGKAAELVA